MMKAAPTQRPKLKPLYKFHVTFICRGRPFEATVDACDSEHAKAVATHELGRSCSEFDYIESRVVSVVQR